MASLEKIGYAEETINRFRNFTIEKGSVMVEKGSVILHDVQSMEFWMRPDVVGVTLLVLTLVPLFTICGTRVPAKTYFHITIITCLMLMCGVAEEYVALGFTGGTEQPVDATQAILDNGFILTKPINMWLQAHPERIGLVGFINSLLLLICFFHAIIWNSVFNNHMGLAYLWALLQTARVLVGLCTSLPRPSDMILSEWDYPNMYSSRGAIFFYSGHVAFYSLYATWLWRKARGSPLSFTAKLEEQIEIRSGNTYVPLPSVAAASTETTPVAGSSDMYIPWNSTFYWSTFFWMLAATSSIIMLATRGHYSIDILTGFLLGFWLSKYVPLLDLLIHESWNQCGGSGGIPTDEQPGEIIYKPHNANVFAPSPSDSLAEDKVVETASVSQFLKKDIVTPSPRRAAASVNRTQRSGEDMKNLIQRITRSSSRKLE